MAGVEQRRPVLGLEIERVLRQVVLAGERLGRGAGEVHRRQVVVGLRQPVGHVEADAGAEAARQAELAGVVARRRDVAQHRDGREVAGAAVGRAVGVEPAAVGVLRRRAGTEDRRVRFDVARQVASRGADVARLDQVAAEQRALHADVPVLHRRRLGVRVEREDRRRPDEGVRRRRSTRPRYGFWKLRPAPLYWLNCAHGVALIATCDAVPAPFWNWS